ncbi:MAG TPA: Ig-like domain-containing protein [Pseudomonadales bacterium]|nr:Ig-like domain-containing protein [Pseudomonadales bacterium]
MIKHPNGENMMLTRLKNPSRYLARGLAALLVAITAGCGGGSGGGQDPVLGTGAEFAPMVTAVAPVPGATDVPTNTSIITAAFSKAMNPATITAPGTFTVACPNGTPITGVVTYLAEGNVATFTLPPATTLPGSTTCRARITTAAKDVGGNAMVAPFIWDFTTGIAPDTTPPTVSAVDPRVSAFGVSLNSLVTASFSEPMDPLTINTSTVLLTCPVGTAKTGTVGYAVSGNVATLTPSSPLPASTSCMVTITTGVKDVAGNAMASAFVWTFQTGAAPDTLAPTVTSTIPAANATGVAFNALVTASFSEPMNPLSITNATFSLACPNGTATAGTVGYAVSGNVATFTPNSPLPASTTCTATISVGAKDVAGNAIASPYIWTFTTGVAPDTTAPTVSSTVPLTNATAVPVNTLVTASFSEPMNPLTITTATVKLACPVGTPVTATVGYAATGNVATLTPTSTLPASTVCTATISTGVKDVAGNAMAAPYSWNFTTGLIPDVTKPTVISTLPVAGATNVVLNTLVTATFSEPMDPLTITTATAKLACPTGTPVTGVVSYAVNSHVATITPNSPLPASTVCTATITTGAKDVAGNAMLSLFSWIFTTGAAPDTTPPTVILVNPANLATGVAVNSAVNATFSEAMAPLSLSTATVTLQVSGPPVGPAVAGLVSYDPLSHIATFTPASDLAFSTQYTATIKGGPSGAKDVAGNALVLDYVWTFTTAAAGSGLAPGAVPLGSAATFGIMATAAITNTGFSTINGDVSLDPGTSMTGFPAGIVNGSIHINDAISAQARADLLVAYNFAKALPPGAPISAGADLGALYPVGIPPGTYTSASTMLVATPLVLDAGGNANAVWVFQIGSSLTTNASVSLANGAQAKNVFWVPTADATIGVGTIFYGTIVSGRDVTGVTAATINGRILAGAITAGTIALDNNTVNVPAP